MIVIGTSHPQGNDSHLAGIELTTGAHAVGKSSRLAGTSNPVSIELAVRFGRTQRRSRHPAEVAAHRPRTAALFLTDPSDHEHPNPDPLGRPIFGKGTFNRDGTVFITSVKDSGQLWDVAEGKISTAPCATGFPKAGFTCSRTRRCFAGNRRYRRLCGAKKKAGSGCMT